MSDALSPVGTTQSEVATTLVGVLLDDGVDTVRIRVTDGTWTFDRHDVLGLRKHSGFGTPPGTVSVDIRPGATADFTRRLRIDVSERPLTLAAPPSPTFGDARLRQLTESWVRHLGLDDSALLPATFTCAQTRSQHGSDDGVHCDSLD